MGPAAGGIPAARRLQQLQGQNKRTLVGKMQRVHREPGSLACSWLQLQCLQTAPSDGGGG